MSHIFVKAPALENAGVRAYTLGKPTGGVRHCRFSSDLEPHQSPHMKNLLYTDGLLTTRFGQERVFSGFSAAGDLHSRSETAFFGSYLLHIGTVLWRFSGTQPPTALSSDMPDTASFMFEMNATLYVFCRCGRVYTVDSGFTVTQVELPERQAFVRARYDMTSYEECEDTSDNFLMGRISVTYLSRSSGIPYYKLPTLCDTGFPVTIENAESGTVISPETYTVSGDTVTLSRTLTDSYKITYMPAPGGRFRENDAIFGCTTTACYGGNSSGGTRVFFSGNPDYPGYYYHSELLSPLEVKKLSYDVIGNGGENIRRLAKQKDVLVALCDRSVHSIRYSFDSEAGATFRVTEISPKIGCDMPDSVQLIDNRLVFGKSGEGIFLLDSSDYTDELSVRSLSGNIAGSADTVGFLSEDAEALKKAVSIDCDRKYLLVCAPHAYLWDYGASPYYAGTEPARAEKSLAWYEFDGLYENALFFYDGAVYGTKREADALVFVRLSKDCPTDLGEAIVCEYRSADCDMAAPVSGKTLREVCFSALRGAADAVLDVTVLCDGREVCTQRFTVPRADADAVTAQLWRIAVRVPPYKGYRFSVAVCGAGGCMGIDDLQFRFCAKRIETMT